MTIDDTQTETARSRWAAGLCPCCGQTLDTDRDGNPPITIGTHDNQPVQICGECQRRGHHHGDVAPALLHAIATGNNP